MSSNKYKEFGRYKIQTYIPSSLDKKLYENVKKYTSIANLGDGEIVFYIEPKYVHEIIDYEIKEITNIHQYLQLSAKEMTELKDTNLIQALKFLERLMIGYLNKIQKDMINMLGKL